MKRRPLVLGGAALALAPAVHAQAPGPAIDWPVVTLLDGRRIEPASWQGRPALVVFWATWCGFCKRHNVHLDRLYRQAGDRGVAILGVATDADAALVRRTVAERGYAFPVCADGDALRRRFTARRVVPMTCLVDRDGRLRQSIPGEMAADDLMALAGAASARPGG